MAQETINTVRYRTLVVALWLATALSASAAVIAARVPGATLWGPLLFLLPAAINLGLMPFAAAARRRGDRPALERIALLVLIVGGLAILQRIVIHTFITWPASPEANPFRPVFQFLPFFFIACVALLRARRALVVCWIAWGAVASLAVAGFVLAGIRLQAEGALTLLVWLLIANPLFILLLHGLPHYEDALDRSHAEIEAMRSRAELVEKLSESEQRFNLVVEGLQVGVWDRGDARLGKRRWWSPRFYELIGYTPEEMEPTEDNLKSLLHPAERERVWREGSEQLRTRDIMDIDFRLHTKHRGYRWFNSHAKAQRDARGRIVRVAGAIADVHDRKVAEEELKEAKAKMTHLAYRDTLTDLHNRRSFDEQFQREWERARRYNRPLSLLLMDLDFFKPYNDRYGHAAGDQCLVEIAHLIQICLHRPADFVARLGGEEFAVLLPETHTEGALEVGLRINATVRSAAIPHEASSHGVVTASVGLATASYAAPWPASPEVLFEQADQALYRVKRRGRDGVIHYSGMDTPGISASTAA